MFVEQSTFPFPENSLETRYKSQTKLKKSQTQVSSLQPNLLVQQQRYTQQYKKWKWGEQLLYYRFVKNNKKRLQKTTFTKKYNKFEKMAAFISTKTITQCRSHHQKSVSKYGSLDNFIQAFERQIKYSEYRKIEIRQMGTQTQLLDSSKPEKAQIQENSNKQSRISIQDHDLKKKPLFQVEEVNSNS